MKSIENLKEKFHAAHLELYTALVENIREFVLKYGVKKNDEVAVDLDQELNQIVEPITLCVETDRHCDEYGYRDVDRISVNTETKEIYFRTETYTKSHSEMTIQELMEIEEYLHIFDENEDNDFVIKDGEISLNED